MMVVFKLISIGVLLTYTLAQQGDSHTYTHTRSSLDSFPMEIITGS